MARRSTELSSPFLLGFDEIERALDRVAKAADGYPPYNIERVPRENGRPERLRITLAVTGFTRDQLDVSVEENQLLIRGRQQDDKTRQYLHRGIAARQFQRTFVLADGMEALSADLQNGLLAIDLWRPEPRRAAVVVKVTEEADAVAGDLAIHSGGNPDPEPERAGAIEFEAQSPPGPDVLDQVALNLTAATLNAVQTADAILEKMRRGNSEIEEFNNRLIARLDGMHVANPAG